MGNEREIKNVFLPEEENKSIVKKYAEEAKSYYLDGHAINEKSTISYIVESEFAKTKKNKNKLAIFLLLIFTVVSISVTLGFTYYLENSGSNVKVDVGNFSALNLQELIQNMQLNIKRVDMLKQLLGIKHSRMEEEIRVVKIDADDKISEVLRMAISTVEKDRRRKDITTRRDQLIEEIKIRYGGEISDIENEISMLEKTIIEQQDELKKESEIKIAATESTISTPNFFETYDPTLPEKISNYFQRELEFTKRESDRKLEDLNPNFGAGDPAGISVANARVIDAPASNPNKFMQNNNNNFYNILRRLEAVPYQNSVPNALNSLATYYSNVTIQYQILLTNQNDGKSKIVTQFITNNTLDTNAVNNAPVMVGANPYANAMEYLIRTRGEGVGYVLNGSNPKDILLFIAKVYTIKKGSKAELYRNEQLIGEVEMTSVGEGVATAKMLKPAVRGIQIMPFDRLVIIAE